MTVRTWFTISALVLLALAVAVVVRLVVPVAAPTMVARVGDTRIDGVLVESCWPQRGDDVRCEEGSDEEPRARDVAPSGELRLILNYPAQPDEGSIVIDGSGEEVLRKRRWDDDVRYDLDPGTYTVTAQADYDENAYVRYRFVFRITRSGS